MKKQKKDPGVLDALMLKIPAVHILGGKNITIENYGGIIDYDEEFLSFDTSIGIVKIFGKCFTIKTITDDEITLVGEVEGLSIK